MDRLWAPRHRPRHPGAAQASAALRRFHWGPAHPQLSSCCRRPSWPPALGAATPSLTDRDGEDAGEVIGPVVPGGHHDALLDTVLSCVQGVQAHLQVSCWAEMAPGRPQAPSQRGPQSLLPPSGQAQPPALRLPDSRVPGPYAAGLSSCASRPGRSGCRTPQRCPSGSGGKARQSPPGPEATAHPRSSHTWRKSWRAP